MKKIVSVICIYVFSSFLVHSQQSINIWQNKEVPSQNGLDEVAELIIYNPERDDSTLRPAILICPGGGYASVSMQYEGHAFAQWLTSQGFVAIILKYRLPNTQKEVPFDDAEEALKIVDGNAAKLGIDMERLGIAGFSAGGHLAATLSNKLANEGINPRPLYTILFYPVISFNETTKGGTRNNLLGLNPSATDIYAYSANMQITEKSTPTILLTADNDHSVPATHSSNYYETLKQYNIPATLYIFPEGDHGWAMLDSFKYNKKALLLLGLWLEQFK